MITLVNKSDLISDDDVAVMARACAAQLRYHVAPAWRMTPVPVVFAKSEALAPPGSWVLGVMNDPDQADALGWHSEDNGVYYGRVFVSPVLDNGGDALTRSLSVASVASHEVLEIFIDPACNGWRDKDDQHQIALEICDPVESDSYPIRVGTKTVSVSNFVTEKWFDPQATSGPFDYMGNVSSPFEMSHGGYVVVNSGGQVSQQFGRHYPGWRKDTKKSPLARTARRVAAHG